MTDWPRRYRWLDRAGNPVSPLHRSPVTARRWLGRQAREPRIRPKPAMLVAELARDVTIAGQRTRLVPARDQRRPLTHDERAHLLAENRPIPLSAADWFRRQGERYRNRGRRRAGTRALTSQLRAGVRA